MHMHLAKHTLEQVFYPLTLHCEPFTVPGEGGSGDEETGKNREAGKNATQDPGLAKTYSRTMMSARLLRLQTTDEAQAGFGAEQLKVLLNAFFKAGSLRPLANFHVQNLEKLFRGVLR